jgi:hypothetical protein
MLQEALAIEDGLRDADRRDESLTRLRALLTRYARTAERASAPDDRSRARRVLRAIASGASERTDDPDYRKLLDQLGLRGRQP